MSNSVRSARSLGPKVLNRGRKTPILRGGLLLLALAASVSGCDRNIEPYAPGEEPREPDLARIFPGPPGGVGSAEGQSENEGATPRGAVPPTRAEGPAPPAATTAARGAGAGGAILGEIALAPELAMARPDQGVLFVIARPQGATGGPPLAVLRIPDPDFPLSFSIGPENVMIPTMQFAGPISLSARLDADGNAMTRGPGDISSPVVEGLTPGEAGVELTLSERS
ncbi:MAG: hypothetical protein NXI30_09160 [bacterium]|nr:hypothetical protein [bacterium]